MGEWKKHINREAVAVMRSKRPKRDTVIGQEDIINLKIALGTAKTIEEFIKLV